MRAFSLIDFQQNILYILMQYVCVPLPPSLDPIWPNQLCYKKAPQLHTHKHTHTDTLCELIGWSSRWSLRGLQLNRAIIRVWMTVGEGSTLPLSPLFHSLSPRPDHVQVITALLTFAMLRVAHSESWPDTSPACCEHTKRVTHTPSGQGSVRMGVSGE